MTGDDPLDQFSLRGQLAVVTGASSGLGARFVRVLHAAGASIVACARRTQQLNELCGPMPGVYAYTADLLVTDERERLFEEVLAEHGRIDVLVNNAGMSRAAPIQSELLEDFRDVLELNVTAVWHLSKLVGTSMVQSGGGAIVNVASALGHVASAPMAQASYAASKAAVVNLTRELAVQWARSNVRVNALCPGFFPSEMTHGIVQDRKALTFLQRETPMCRLGLEHELDGPLLLLCSEAGSYMTGASLLVDGGWTAR